MEAFKKRLFRNIPWSTNDVFDRMVERLRKNGSLFFLPLKRDIDSFADLKAFYEKYCNSEVYKTIDTIKKLKVLQKFKNEVKYDCE